MGLDKQIFQITELHGLQRLCPLLSGFLFVGRVRARAEGLLGFMYVGEATRPGVRFQVLSCVYGDQVTPGRLDAFRTNAQTKVVSSEGPLV